MRKFENPDKSGKVVKMKNSSRECYALAVLYTEADSAVFIC
jgi:hypothetical protein